MLTRVYVRKQKGRSGAPQRKHIEGKELHVDRQDPSSVSTNIARQKGGSPLNASQTTTVQANKSAIERRKQVRLSLQNHRHAAHSGRTCRGRIGGGTRRQTALGMAARDGVGCISASGPPTPLNCCSPRFGHCAYAVLSLFHAGAQATAEGKPLLPESVLKIRDRADAKKLEQARQMLANFLGSAGRKGWRRAMNWRPILARSRPARRARSRCPGRNDLGMFELVLDAHSAPLPARILLVFAAGHYAGDRRGPLDLEDQTAPKAGIGFG